MAEVLINKKGQMFFISTIFMIVGFVMLAGLITLPEITQEKIFQETSYADKNLKNVKNEKIMSVLRVPANWCDIVSMTPNIKACTSREMTDSWQLIFYTGRRTYQLPEDAYPFTFSYRNVEQRQGYLNIALNAEEGPLGTKEHKMRFEAVHLSSGKTFVHVGYSHTYGTLLRLAGNVYFSTVGRDKIGFTVTGTDSNGNPVYIDGARGAIERNAVRYYFAIQSLMDTLHHPEENRFNMRINEWFDLTDRYRKQLFEMEKKEYLAVKTEEHKNQVALQRRVKSGGP